MQFCTEEMADEILTAEDRVDQICQQSVLRIVSITEEDHKNLASDLVKLDKSLYWTDFKESFKLAPICYMFIQRIRCFKIPAKLLVIYMCDPYSFQFVKIGINGQRMKSYKFWKLYLKFSWFKGVL